MLVLAPPVSLLRLRTTVHLVRSAAVSKQAPGTWERRDVPLVVFRRELKMRHVELEPLPWALLDAFRGPTAVSVALDRLVADGADPDVLMSKLGGWFQGFAERGLLSAA